MTEPKPLPPELNTNLFDIEAVRIRAYRKKPCWIYRLEGGTPRERWGIWQYDRSANTLERPTEASIRAYMGPNITVDSFEEIV